MSLAEEPRIVRVFVVMNAHSGHADPIGVVETLRSASVQAGRDREFEIHETQGGEDLASIVREAVQHEGFDLVVAAGGDGTVSAVANGLVGNDAVLAIIPLGTTNVLARELGVPLDLEASCGLVTGPSSIARVDAMKVGGAYYFTQIGVGIDALMIDDTSEVDKRRIGVFAYVRTMVEEPGRLQAPADHRHGRRPLRPDALASGDSGQLRNPGDLWTAMGSGRAGRRRSTRRLHFPAQDAARVSPNRLELPSRPPTSRASVNLPTGLAKRDSPGRRAASCPGGRRDPLADSDHGGGRSERDPGLHPFDSRRSRRAPSPKP